MTNESILKMFEILNIKDEILYKHLIFVSNLSKLIGIKLNISKLDLDMLVTSSLVHDIGHIVLPDYLVNIDRKLLDKELELIKTHVEKTVKLLTTLNYNENIIQIVEQHHERIDGSGYPYGLKEQEMLYLSKILTISDSTSSMLNGNIYNREKKKFEEMKKILLKSNKFDKYISNICLEVLSNETDNDNFICNNIFNNINS